MIKKIKIISLFVLMAGVLFLFPGCSNLAAVSDEAFLAEETVAPIATTDISQIKPVSMEEEVMTGEITWKILEVKDLGPSIVSSDNYTYKAILGKFIILKFMVKNNSSEARILYDLNVIDSNARVYSLCLPAYAYVASPSEACAIVDIFSEVDYTFDAPFDVSPDSEGLVLEVTDLLNPPVNKAYIDLGI